MAYTKQPVQLVSRRGYTSTSGIEEIFSSGKDLLSSKYKAEGAAEYWQSQTPQQQKSGTGWILPVAIVAGAGVAIYLITRKK